jgi:glycerophosphoryl diester phosphodiesterase
MKKQSLIIVALVAGAFASAQAQTPGHSVFKKSPWNVVDHIPLDKVIVQSHRGAGVLAPENTVGAFELGWKLGTYPEADLRTTSDGVIVAFHDADFSRVVKGASEELKKKGVKDLTFAELQKLDVGAYHGDSFLGRHVSKMTEVFALMQGKPDRFLYMDIKNVDLSELANEVKQFHVEKQVILASPKPEILREFKALVPESGTLLWMSGDEKSKRKRIAVLKKENFAGITQLQIHIRTNEPASVEFPYTPSPEFIRELGPELRSRHILFQALPYTDSTTVYGQLLDLGLMSFATDYPDVTKREIKYYYEKHSSKK